MRVFYFIPICHDISVRPKCVFSVTSFRLTHSDDIRIVTVLVRENKAGESASARNRPKNNTEVRQGSLTGANQCKKKCLKL